MSDLELVKVQLDATQKHLKKALENQAVLERRVARLIEQNQLLREMLKAIGR
jgi:hypothetical protein